MSDAGTKAPPPAGPRPPPARPPRRERPATGGPPPARGASPAAAPLVDRRGRQRLGTAGALVFLAVAVVAFTGAWAFGHLVLDGPGTALWLGLARDDLAAGQFPMWIPTMWSGTPGWLLAPFASILGMVPLGEVLGDEAAVRAATVIGQVVAGWGAFVLARSLWGRGPAPVLAGLFYALSPQLIATAALFGHEPPVWVIAATPWFVWSLRNCFRRGGVRWIFAAGLIGGFAVLQQGEHAFAVLLIGAVLLVSELVRGRTVVDAPRPRVLLARGSGVVAVVLGITAHWLFPFLAMKNSFALNPPEELRISITSGGITRLVGNNPGAFMTRPDGLSGKVGFVGFDFLGEGSFYLGVTLVLASFVTAALLARREDTDGTVGAVLIASLIGVWISTGDTPLARGHLADAGILPVLALGVFAGLVLAGFIRRLRPTRTFVPTVATAVAMVALACYATPFLTLRDEIPVLSDIRFPRLYPIALLGLALGAAYPVVALGRWAAAKAPTLESPERERVKLLPFALAAVLALAFLVDVWPARSFYFLDPPTASSSVGALRTVAEAPGGTEVATPLYPDARIDQALLDVGADMVTGWPHPVAAEQIWRLTAGTVVSPIQLRNRALGLAGTDLDYSETVIGDPDTAFVSENPDALPQIRAYEQVVAVDDRNLASDVALDLAHAHVGVVTGEAEALEDTGIAVIGTVPSDACQEPDEVPDELAAEVGAACARRSWLGRLNFPRPIPLADGAGGVVEPKLPGLRELHVWMGASKPPTGSFVLDLSQLGEDGQLTQVTEPTIATAVDDDGLVVFEFDPIEDSHEHTYVFTVSCPGCEPSEETSLVVLDAIPKGSGNLVVGGTLRTDRVAAVKPIYGALLGAPAPKTDLVGVPVGGNSWRVRVNGNQPALVVVATAWFPGWKAELDGEPVAALQADGAFVGVAVPAGDHVVDLTWHRPAAVNLGMVVTAGTLIAAIGALVGLPLLRVRRRARRAPSAPPSDSSASGDGVPPSGSRGSRSGPDRPAAPTPRTTPGRAAAPRQP
jgi:hypothetical protein